MKRMTDWTPDGTCTCNDCGSQVRVSTNRIGATEDGVVVDPGNRTADYAWYCVNMSCINNAGEWRGDQEDGPDWATWERGSLTGFAGVGPATIDIAYAIPKRPSKPQS